mgnify:CR=1 FL=1
MSDELTVCAAAFFRSIGKDVTTSNEFVMTTSLELKWMSPSDSKLLLKALLDTGVLAQKGEYVRTAGDLSGLDVPLAYKPSEAVMDIIHGKVPVKKESVKKESDPDMFHDLIGIANDNGIQTKDFVPACTRIQKRLSIDVSVAALMVLRDNGVDVTDLSDQVYGYVSSS